MEYRNRFGIEKVMTIQVKNVRKLAQVVNANTSVYLFKTFSSRENQIKCKSKIRSCFSNMRTLIVFL